MKKKNLKGSSSLRKEPFADMDVTILNKNNYLENNERNDLINLFVNFSKHFVDKEGGEKLDYMLEYFLAKGISAEYEKGIGLILNKQESPRVICVSHMDLIPKFQKGFKLDNVCALDDNYIIGALDNTITNAVAGKVIERLLNEDIKDVEILFSEGEEVGFHGMFEYLKVYKEKSENSFFVNLDVTNEGWKKYGSIEYDETNFKMLKKVQKILNGKKMFFTNDRVCDDTDAIVRKNCCGFSYCLPTKNNIHSYNNKAKLKALLPYMEGLYLLLKEITYKSKPEKNIFSYQFDEALNVNSKSKLTERTKPSYGGHSDYNYDFEKSVLSDDICMDDFSLDKDVEFDFDEFDSDEENVTSIMLENIFGINLTAPLTPVDRFFAYAYDNHEPAHKENFMRVHFEGGVTKGYKSELFDEIYRYLYQEDLVENISNTSFLFKNSYVTFKKIYDNKIPFDNWWDDNVEPIINDILAGRSKDDYDFSLLKWDLRDSYFNKLDVTEETLMKFVPGDIDGKLLIDSIVETLT